MPKDNSKISKVRAGKIEKKKTQPTSKTAAVSKSEIDDIFASKKAQPTPKAAVASKSEIDDIFSAKKQPLAKPECNDVPKATVKPAKSVTVVDATTSITSSSNQQQKRPPKSDDFADSRGKSSKYTEDGLRVFYMEDLRIGEGEGATELCPFDCTCCF
ncbi:hypothetical protein FBU31_000418 [Coemansia sp. 'formosensis']|nr:hypothetical protein FBU31_000418 [Coemansia sp. 'formosensis']